MVQGTMVDLAAFLPALQAAVSDRAPQVRDALAAVAPKRTGVFAGGIDATVANTGDGVTLTATADDPLATWITEGTSPHEIRPANAKWLAFEVGSGGTVFAKVVHHPGTAPNDFVEVAWDSAIESLMDDAIAEALQALA